jgi:hypothetical protein
MATQSARCSSSVQGEIVWHGHSIGSLAEEITGAWDGAEGSGPAVAAIAWIAVYLRVSGLHELVEALLARIGAVADRFHDDPVVYAPVLYACALRALFACDLGGGYMLLERTVQCCEQAGDLRGACSVRISVGFWAYQLGAYAEAVARLRAALADAERMGLFVSIACALHNLGLALGNLGAVEEARAAEGRPRRGAW